MGYKENKIIVDRLMNLSANERLFRINAGMGWAGKILKKTNNAIVLGNPNPLHAAPTGWPDLSGWTEIEITPDMIGKKIAVFTGEELKATGKLSKEQKQFRDIIQRMGGIYRVIN